MALVANHKYKETYKLFPLLPSYKVPTWASSAKSILGVGLATTIFSTDMVKYNYLMAGAVGGTLGFYFGQDHEYADYETKTGALIWAGLGTAMGLGAVAMRNENLRPSVRFAIAGAIGGMIGWYIQDSIPLNKFGYNYDSRTLYFPTADVIGTATGALLFMSLLYFTTKR